MEIKDQDNREIIIGGGKEMMFSIDESSPIIFDILRNKMYSNKIGAVAREVASNSRDANREAGLDLPIEIEFTNNSFLATIGDTTVIFRDFGIGISPERMADVFLKYAASTKRDSNLQTGGFGLGAKTPFAYTDSFVVKTRSGGVEYIYNAIIDSTGKGKMILISEDPTEELSGTEIIIPILSNDDRVRFEKEIYKSTMYWEKVSYINFNSAKPEVHYILDTPDFKITRQGNFTPFVGLLDGIPYELKTDETQIYGYSVFINLDLSEITINANRETLQYDEKTEKYVKEQINLYKKSLNEIIHDYLCNNATFPEAYKRFKNLSRQPKDHLSLDYLIHSITSQNHTDFDTDVYFEGVKIERIHLKCHHVQLVKWSEKGFKYSYTSIDDNYPLYYFDKRRNSIDKNTELQNFLLVKPVKGDMNISAVDTKKEKEYIESLGYEMKNYSDVKPEKIVPRKVKSDITGIFVRGSYNPVYNKRKLSFDKANMELVDMKKDVLFIPVDTFDYYSMPRYSSEKMAVLNFIKKVETIYYVKRDVYEKYLRPAGYRTAEEVFKGIRLNTFSKYLEIEKVKTALNQIPSIILNHFPELLPKSFLILKDSEQAKVPNELRSINWERLGVKESKFDYDGLVDKFFKVVNRDYPLLLTYVDKSYVGEETLIKNLKHYVKISNCNKR